MKIGLIVPANLKYAPYVQYYLKVLDASHVEYKLMVWNKVGINEDVACVLNYSSVDSNRKKIFIGHILFAGKCKQYIKKEKIDHMIIFTIAPLFFLGENFLRRFNNKMIIDIRDDSPFRSRFSDKLKRICSLAKSVVVSSNNYSPWTGRETVLCHNVDVDLLKKYVDLPIKKVQDIPHEIVFAGTMNEADINISILKILGNSKLFSFGFVGNRNEGKKIVEKFVSENQYMNVWFEGTYKKEDIVNKYREKAELINIFRANTIINRNALPNKLYDAVVSAVPVVVFRHNEAIVNYVEKYNLGIILDDLEPSLIEDSLINGIEKFDYSLFQKGRAEFLDKVLDDQRSFEEMLQTFIS